MLTVSNLWWLLGICLMQWLAFNFIFTFSMLFQIFTGTNCLIWLLFFSWLDSCCSLLPILFRHSWLFTSLRFLFIIISSFRCYNLWRNLFRISQRVCFVWVMMLYWRTTSLLRRRFDRSRHERLRRDWRCPNFRRNFTRIINW